MAKDGQAYLKSLRDSRCIYIDGRRVADVTEDAAFANWSPRLSGCTTFRPRWATSIS
jgi:aromatic ring hydroxylase